MESKWTIGSILEILRSPKLVAWIAVTCALLLFIPASWLPKNFVDTVRDQFGIWLVLALCASGAMLFIEAVCLVYTKLRDWKTHRWRVRRLNNLTPQEKHILRRYIRENTQTQDLSMKDGVVIGLEIAQIIYRATQISKGSREPVFDYNIEPWAWKYLHEYGEILKDKVNT